MMQDREQILCRISDCSAAAVLQYMRARFNRRAGNVRDARAGGSDYQVIQSEFVSWAASYHGPKFHAVLCDPPYGLEFMGKEWDAPHRATSFPKLGNLGGFADGEKPSFARQNRHLPKLMRVFEVWGKAMIPLLYPGAVVFMFGGTRTWEYVSVGMQMAGFSKWDTLMWLYGQGFPKAQDISKLIDKHNGDERTVVIGVKPGHEEFANRRTLGEVQALRETGGGGFARPWMDDEEKVRAYHMQTAPASDISAPWSGHKTCALKPAWEPILCFRAPSNGKTYAGLALEHGSGCLNIDGARIPISDDGGVWGTSNATCAPAFNGSATKHEFRSMRHQGGRYPANLCLDEEAAAMLDEQAGALTSSKPAGIRAGGRLNCYGTYVGGMLLTGIGDSGGASRFFYIAKSPGQERNAGLKRRNTHPTVKPITLTRWLAALLLPPESVKTRRVLVPFAGSGSEMIGALLAGWDEVTGIEKEKEYCAIAAARLKHWNGGINEADMLRAALTRAGERGRRSRTLLWHRNAHRAVSQRY